MPSFYDQTTVSKPFPPTAPPMVVTPTSTERKRPVKISNKKFPSAYNLFFQYLKIVDMSSVDDPTSSRLGLEDIDASSSRMVASEDELNRYRKKVIKRTLADGFCRKTTADVSSLMGMDFAEMSKHISKKWNAADTTTKTIFRALAKEHRASHQQDVYDSYKASSDRFLVAPNSFHEVEKPSTDSVSANAVASCNNPSDNERIEVDFNQEIWTPFSFNGNDDNEMSNQELCRMVSGFDWS
mmetsp:Transcript_21856/g.47371  ORF Transcript_21856/g.47371 Transcript_21856/m.47371 type:complete len:240 (-) Transcript_21856:75-794(-)